MTDGFSVDWQTSENKVSFHASLDKKVVLKYRDCLYVCFCIWWILCSPLCPARVNLVVAACRAQGRRCVGRVCGQMSAFWTVVKGTPWCPPSRRTHFCNFLKEALGTRSLLDVEVGDTRRGKRVILSCLSAALKHHHVTFISFTRCKTQEYVLGERILHKQTMNKVTWQSFLSLISLMVLLP